MNATDFENSPRIALDTEFVWTKTYRARLGLVQAATSALFDRTRLHTTPPAAIPVLNLAPELRTTVLLDPMAANPAPLAQILEEHGTPKILHDALQDLQHLARWTGARPRAVFDTKTAAGFCYLPSTLSLAKLLEETVGVSLPKTETRTDWCRRPLSPQQLEYAAQDVAYLDAAALELLNRAKKAGTMDWMMEEMERFDNQALYADEDPERAIRHVKIPLGSIPRGNFAARRRLSALAKWREEEASKRDLPRKWIASDETLVTASVRPPRKMEDLPPRSISPHLFAAFSAALRDADTLPVDVAAEEAAALAAERAARARRDARDKATAILAKIDAVARPAGVDPALVASRADATEWVLTPDAPEHPLNRGWRFELVGSELRKRV